MSNLNNDFGTLETEVRKQLGQQGRALLVVEYRGMPGRAYMFKAPKGFAWVHLKTRLGCLRVGTKRAWAAKASVDYDGYEKPHSAHNEPGYHWDIAEGDNTNSLKVARYLAQICRVRHSNSETQLHNRPYCSARATEACFD